MIDKPSEFPNFPQWPPMDGPAGIRPDRPLTREDPADTQPGGPKNRTEIIRLSESASELVLRAASEPAELAAGDVVPPQVPEHQSVERTDGNDLHGHDPRGESDREPSDGAANVTNDIEPEPPHDKRAQDEPAEFADEASMPEHPATGGDGPAKPPTGGNWVGPVADDDPERGGVQLIETAWGVIGVNRDYPDQDAVNELLRKLDEGLPADSWRRQPIPTRHPNRAYYADNIDPNTEPTYFAKVTTPSSQQPQRDAEQNGWQEFDQAAEVHAILASDEAQALLREQGFASMEYVPPLAVIDDEETGAQTVVRPWQPGIVPTHNVENDGPNVREPGSWEERTDNLIVQLVEVFELAGVVPEGLGSNQLKITVDEAGREHVHLLSAEEFYLIAPYVSPFDSAETGDRLSQDMQTAESMMGKVWVSIVKEEDPRARMAKILTVIGDNPNLTEQAVVTLYELSEPDARNLHGADFRLSSAMALIDVLLDSGHFAEADRIFKEVRSYNASGDMGKLSLRLLSTGRFVTADSVAKEARQQDSVLALEVMARMLHRGYTGPNDEYLHQDISGYAQGELLQVLQVQGPVERYLCALAYNGVNLLEGNGSEARALAGRLAERGIVVQDLHYGWLADAYASGGHAELAQEAKDKIANPYLRAKACIALAKAADAGDTSWGSNVSEALAQVPRIHDCDASCGRIDCAPAIDVRQVETDLAVLYSQQGGDADMTMAAALVGPHDKNPSIRLNQATVYAELYAREGSRDYRKAALRAITVLSQSGGPTVPMATKLATLIERIGQADFLHDRTELLDGVLVPRVSVELDAVFGLMPTMQALSVPLVDFDAFKREAERWPDYKEECEMQRRALLRDHALVSLVKTVARMTPGGSPVLTAFIRNFGEWLRASSAQARELWNWG